MQNEKQKAAPKKPIPPAGWHEYADKETVIEWFWAWERADYDPVFTPDGRPWLDQDREFWEYVYYIQDLWAWARYRAKNPAPMSALPALTMDDL